MKVLLAHGSSDSVHGQMVELLAKQVSALLADEVGVAYLSDGILPAQATVLPLFLGNGAHVTEDAPKLAQRSGATLLSPVGANSEAITSLVTHRASSNTIFLLYQAEGFEALQRALESYGKIALLHGEPSLADVLRRHAPDETITVQPVLLFRGRSLARVRRMIDESGMLRVTLAPPLSELEGFAGLVAGCLRGSE